MHKVTVSRMRERYAQMVLTFLITYVVHYQSFELQINWHGKYKAGQEPMISITSLFCAVFLSRFIFFYTVCMCVHTHTHTHTQGSAVSRQSGCAVKCTDYKNAVSKGCVKPAFFKGWFYIWLLCAWMECYFLLLYFNFAHTFSTATCRTYLLYPCYEFLITNCCQYRSPSCPETNHTYLKMSINCIQYTFE